MTRRIPAVALCLIAAACASIPIIGRRQPEFWAFTAPWDPLSATSTARARDRADALITGWAYLDSATGEPRIAFPDTVARPLRDGERRMMLVTSWHGLEFHRQPIRVLAGDRARLGAAARTIAAAAVAGGYDGLVMDFESLTPADLGALATVVSALSDSAHARGIRTTALAIPPTDTAGYPARPLAPLVDKLIVMLYDQHSAGGPPGPVSAPEWVRRSLAVRIGEVGASRLVAGLPLYGYRWAADRGGAISISYDDARRLAAEAGITLSRDPASHTLTARRDRLGATEWELWVTDAELLRRLVESVAETGVRTFALWRLGQEDPAVWETVVK